MASRVVRSAIVAFSVVHCALCNAVRSAPANAAETTPIHLGTIEVSTPPDSAASPSAFSTIIAPRDHMQRFATVQELLAATAGTVTRSLGGPGQFSTVAIRGSSAEQVAVFIDGVRINAGGLGAVDVATLPMAGIERIEVIRGGGTTQFGSDALGGVINIVTRRAEEGRAGEVSGTGGSFLTFKTTGHLATRNARRGFGLGFSHWQSKGNYPFQQATTTLAGTPVGGGGTFRRDHNRTIADDLLLRADVATDAHTHLHCTNDFFWTDRQLPGTEAEATLLTPANPLEATQRIYRNVTHLGVRFDELWTPPLSLELGINNTLEHTRFADASPAIGTPIARTTRNDTINPYLRWGYLHTTAASTHRIDLRYDYRRDMYDDTAGNATTSTIGARARDLHQVRLQDEWWFAHDRVTLLPVAHLADAGDFPAIVGGKLGVIVRPVAPFAVKANIESAHRYPTFTELFYPDEGYLRGNPNLAKESALNWDAGATATWPRGKVEAVYFQHRIANTILFVPISATTIQPINTFAARADGIEASAEATPLSFLRVAGNYTWLRARFTSTGLQLPGRPRHTANLRIEGFRTFSQHWGGRVFAETQWVGRVPVNVANSVFLAARTTFDLGMTAMYTKGVTRKATSVTCDMWDVTCKKPRVQYFATIEAKDLTNVQVYDARGFPLPRRSVFFTIGAKWS